MTLAPDAPAPTAPGPNTDTAAPDRAAAAALLFREAQRRRRRRWVLRTAAIAAVCVAGLTAAVAVRLVPGASTRGGPPGTAPATVALRRSGATLVYAYSDLRVVDADSGATRTLPLPAPPGGSSDLSMLRVGRSLVLSRGDTAWLYRAGLGGAPLDLGPSLRVVPGPVEGQMWIWSEPCAEAPGCTYARSAGEPPNGTVRLVDDSGRRLGTPVALPDDAHWFPTGQSVTAGLVLAVAYGPAPGLSEIWDPTSGHVVRVPMGPLLGAHGDWIATASASACPRRCSVQVTNIDSGVVRSMLLPAGVTLGRGAAPGAVAPDGSMLALEGTLGRARSGEIIVVHLRSGATAALPGGGAALDSVHGPPLVTWSRSGWLFAARIGGGRVLAWRPGWRRMAVVARVTLPVPHLEQPRFQTEDPSLQAL